MGKRRLSLGSPELIPNNTPYTLRAGPDGVRYRNVRAHRVAYLAKDGVTGLPT